VESGHYRGNFKWLQLNFHFDPGGTGGQPPAWIRQQKISDSSPIHTKLHPPGRRATVVPAL
jgi:hypothetical protein